MRFVDTTLDHGPISGPAEARAKQALSDRQRMAVAAPWVILVFVLGAGGFMLWDSRGRANTARATALRAQDELGVTRQRATDAEQQLLGAQGALTREKQEREAEVVALKNELDSKAVQAKQASDQAKKADALADDLERAVAKTEGELVRSRGKLTLNLVDKVLFAVGDDQLTKQGEQVLRKVGGLFNKFPDKAIWVIGHTDDTPIKRAGWISNWELSTARALTVVHFLQDEVKVSPKRLAAAGFGPYRPVSKTSKAKNRRIEIVLLPKDVEMIKE